MKEAYLEIEGICEKHKGIAEDCDHRLIRDMLAAAKNHLMIIDWNERYGLGLSHRLRLHGCNYAKLSEYMSLSYYKDGKGDKKLRSGKWVSWSDDDAQPKDEWLLVIRFPTGAYIFGEDYEYQQDLFQQLFSELRSYNPDYSDTMNKALYWRLENAAEIKAKFDEILKKYVEKNRAEFKARKIAKMKAEIERLEQ